MSILFHILLAPMYLLLALIVLGFVAVYIGNFFVFPVCLLVHVCSGKRYCKWAGEMFDSLGRDN